jgi:uncharacterized protein
VLVDDEVVDTLADLPGPGTDLLVCGSRGYGSVRQVLLGGVSSRVMRTAAYPVMIMPRGVHVSPRSTGSGPWPTTPTDPAPTTAVDSRGAGELKPAGEEGLTRVVSGLLGTTETGCRARPSARAHWVELPDHQVIGRYGVCVIEGSLVELAFLLVAGLLAGGVNAVAGGGSLLVFPALLAIGFDPLAANVTNSVAQWPGYLGVVAGARHDLRGQRRRSLLTSAVAAGGAAVGCLLLLTLPATVFDAVVPVLVLLASALLGLQPWIRRRIGAPEPGWTGPQCHSAALGVRRRRVWRLFRRRARRHSHRHAFAVRARSPGPTHALKGLLSLVVATVTVMIFAVGAPVDWLAVAVLAPTPLLGGFLGAKLARTLRENVLRWAVVALGLAVGIYLLVM